MKIRICVIGLGYVGLPLALALSKHFEVIGFDIDKNKIELLKQGIDNAGEINTAEINKSTIIFSTDQNEISKSNFIIACVPTPINKAKQPDLSFIEDVSKLIGKHLKKNSIVVYESTVYPGVTEEICAPILENNSGLKCGVDFKIGYSPERINPGDKIHTIDKVIKIVSGMDEESLKTIDYVYSKITQTHKAQTIKIAEAAKIIENIQRDLNIALMNELSVIFEKMHIDLHDVLMAAGTKWNFHKYTPGLVGGHCIGIDPYYLTYKAEIIGYHPEVILASRRINDNMAKHIAELTVKALNKMGKTIQGSDILILGLTFKENVKDYRNSKTKDLIAELREYGVNVIAFDPHLNRTIIKEEDFDISNTPLEKVGKVDGIIMTIPHKEFIEMNLSDYEKFYKNGKLFVDVKGHYSKDEALKRGFKYIRL